MSHSLVQSLVRSANLTFNVNKHKSDDLFKESLNKLKILLSQINYKDLNLNKELMSEPIFSRLRSQKPAVTYVHICETSHFQMCMFGLRHDRSQIPLHNHPDMYGLIKVLFGTVSISNYTALPIDGQYVLPKEVAKRVERWRQQFLIPTLFDGNSTIDSKSKDVCLLTPDERNYHSLVSVGGPAVILDILGPPYKEERECHYFEVIATVYDSQLERDITWILELPEPPSDYQCNSLPYIGPDFQLT